MSVPSLLDIQNRLKALGILATVSGIQDPAYFAAVRGFQRINGLGVDGVVGPKTLAELFPAPLPAREESPIVPTYAKPQGEWPRQVNVPATFGSAGSDRATAGKVILPAPMRIAWNKTQRIVSFNCHQLVAPYMTQIFNQTVSHYGEAQWRALGLDLFGGCFNNRLMRGGSNPSMHAYGIAVDIDPERNQLKWGRDRAELAKPAYEPFWKIVEANGALSLGRARNFDWMHFQFARL